MSRQKMSQYERNEKQLARLESIENKSPVEVGEIIYLLLAQLQITETREAMVINHMKRIDTEGRFKLMNALEENQRVISEYTKRKELEMDRLEINVPMIDWCEHGNMLVCEVCAKRHQSTESA